MAAIFSVNAQTLKTIQSMTAQLGASSDEEVLQKALALARLAIGNADQDSNITLSSSVGGKTINLGKRAGKLGTWPGGRSCPAP